MYVQKIIIRQLGLKYRPSGSVAFELMALYCSPFSCMISSLLEVLNK